MITIFCVFVYPYKLSCTITFGAEIFVTIAWGVLLEEAGKAFQVFLLVSFEVAAHSDYAPVGVVTYATTTFSETDV